MQRAEVPQRLVTERRDHVDLDRPVRGKAADNVPSGMKNLELLLNRPVDDLKRHSASTSAWTVLST